MILVILGLLLGANAEAQEEPEGAPTAGVSSVPAIIVDMQDHWKRYSELADVGDQESADHLAEKMVLMRRQAGMLGNSAFARSFAMRAWRQQQSGKLDAAIKEYNFAVSLEPSAREFRTGLASALAASSTACLPMSPTLGVAQRVSICTLRPMVQPNSASPCRNAPTRI